ncbi:MAG: divergent polysaccharide deacetylase family protein [Lachnospiraceae bacterium]|nr:divergent polysaccharide deacetylase family protein [Lachnospiraceae bacterium]
MFFVLTKKAIKNSFLLVCLFACVVTASVRFINRRAIFASSANTPKGYLAIIIDDFGNHGEGTEEMLALDIPFTAAIMPFSEGTLEDKERVKAAGKEMIVHMPMESLIGKKSWVGDKGIFLNMSDEEIKAVVDETFTVLDGAVGLNNHMGSAIMEDERALNVVINDVADRGLIFIDSRTTAKSVSKKLCESRDCCLLGRDVFLDSTDDIAVVKKQLMKAAEIAVKNGTAIAIGHVGPEGGKITAQAIKDLAPEIEKMGVEFVTITQMKEITDENNS